MITVKNEEEPSPKGFSTSRLGMDRSMNKMRVQVAAADNSHKDAKAHSKRTGSLNDMNRH